MSASASIQKVSPWHEQLIDFMLAQPRAGLKETSEYFGVSMAWLSTVKNSDAFREQWAKRRESHSSAVSVTLVQRVEALAEVALETMTERLEREGASIGLSTLREVSETALKSLGFGNRDGNLRANTINATTNNTMIVVDRDTLARARAARTRMQENSEIPLLETASIEQTALIEAVTAEDDSVMGAHDPVSEGEGADLVEISLGSTESAPAFDTIPKRIAGNRADLLVLDEFSDEQFRKDTEAEE